MSFDWHDTIAALASPAGGASRGIIRLSGPESTSVLLPLFAPFDTERFSQQRVAALHSGTIQLQAIGRKLPADVYLWPNTQSFTGQVAAELHMIGSPPILEAVLTELFAAGARPAQPGEFTLRAFLAGRLDLVQAEAVLGVIDAHDDAALQTALQQLAGGISNDITAVRDDLLELLADLEAGLDFAEEDITFVDAENLRKRITAGADVIDDLLQQATGRMRSTAAMRVVLAGPPNAGKSTLFNALVGKQTALVSDQRGTTRDYLSANLNWHGLDIELIDTAGTADDADEILRRAAQLTGDQLQRAEIILWCTPSGEAGAPAIPQELSASDLLPVTTKCDIPERVATDATLKVSGITGHGLKELTLFVAKRLQDATRSGGKLLGMTAARCHDTLRGAHEALLRAGEVAVAGGGDEFLAIEIREALDELGQVTGAVYTDDLLDRIFSKFCIGK